MAIDETRAKKLLRDFNFPSLFVEELGWDKHKATLSIPIDNRTFELSAVAEKRGMAAFVCECDGSLPDYNLRRKIERQVAKSAHQHFIIFTDAAKTRQIWQWVKREPGKPDACREHHFDRSQSGEAVVQRLKNIVFELAEEENITHVDVTIRARAGFDIEKVTKRFYERFQKEHGTFLKFIQGIPDNQLQRWYASVMLNRLMFIYFIQKKGFLSGDINYLRNKLTASKPKDRYYSGFLCPLFFEGFAKKSDERSAAVNQLLGPVPYLNGGLFLLHQIEELHGKSIQIPDIAFERIFDFFEAYQWHLDERPLRADNEINPDVLGYIFEKYINQKQMGAYYTKEDITEYISKNTVLPFLFDAARPKCKIAFENPNGPTIWDLLKADPDRYIYDAVKKGVDIPLPKEIEAGIKDVSKRDVWNNAASAEFALPTEIWREVLARRQRCHEVRTKLAAGEVRDINELITLNIDIRQFAQDVIENCEGPELLRAFWHAITGGATSSGVTILDPACGSGAFLFAALNILEPLYEACLDRMAVFVEELDRSPQKHRPEKFSDFRKISERVAAHPSRRYFVFKTIILNNLFGVDIMEEATEICKLRLFLKLAAQIDPDATKDNFGIEPLPDIDFNIRAGNTLVGYATPNEVRRSMQEFGSGQMRLGVEDELKSYARFAENVEIADRAFQQFRAMQEDRGMDVRQFASAKETLRERLKKLEEELNRYLASEYGIKPNNSAEYAAWRKSHQPFHWFVDFYGIMNKGGFDAIIGNPPWVEYAKAKKDYTVRNYETESSGNLYALFSERSLQLLHPSGSFSFIVQLPMVSSSRMNVLRDHLRESSGFLSLVPCDDRPGKLFEGLQHCRATIFVVRERKRQAHFGFHTTRYKRWPTELRPTLFQYLQFSDVRDSSLFQNQFAKIANEIHARCFQKLLRKNARIGGVELQRNTDHFIFYQEAMQYWTKAIVGLPYYAKNGRVAAPAHGRYLFFKDQDQAHVVSATINSSIFYLYFISYGDCFHLSDTLVAAFPLDDAVLADEKLITLNKTLMKDLKSHSCRKTILTRDGDEITYAEFDVSKSKPILDEIDKVLARHYGLTEEETDFITNYDIKYRMGLGGEDAEE